MNDRFPPWQREREYFPNALAEISGARVMVSNLPPDSESPTERGPAIAALIQVFCTQESSALLIPAHLLCTRAHRAEFLPVCSVAQLCPTLCEPMDCSPPGSSVHGIVQARILEGLPGPPPGDTAQTLMSVASAEGFFITESPGEALDFSLLFSFFSFCSCWWRI